MCPNLDGVMPQLPYVLLVLFTMPNGGHSVMETAYQYDSPLSCSMRAFIENDRVDDRTYVCVTRSHAALLLPTTEAQPVPTTRY